MFSYVTIVATIIYLLFLIKHIFYISYNYFRIFLLVICTNFNTDPCCQARSVISCHHSIVRGDTHRHPWLSLFDWRHGTLLAFYLTVLNWPPSMTSTSYYSLKPFCPQRFPSRFRSTQRIAFPE